jgi:hypothetical protein
MTITTKYNVGQEVWVIFCENGVAGIAKCRIKDIEIRQFESRAFIKYGLIVTTEDQSEYIISEYEIPDKYYEEYVFPSKEELLKSL